jgi:hypothetical protein
MGGPGDAIYWFGCILAATILVLGVADHWLGQGGFFVFVSWAALAVIPWLIGSSIRYISRRR